MSISTSKFKKPKPFRPLLIWGLGKDRDFFLENLSLMLGSNLPITQALEALKNETKSKKFKKIISKIQEDVDNGLHLWEAFQNSGILPEYSLSLIRIGEGSGKLTENMKVVTEQQQKDAVLRSRIRTAMLYPVLVTGVMLVVGTGIAWFILPRLSTVFLNLRLKLPWSTRLLISFGQFLQHSGYYAIPLFFLFLAVVFYIVFLAPKTKALGQKLLFSLPGVDTLIKQVEISRLGYMLGSLSDSGVPLVEAVGLLEEAATFQVYKKFYRFLKQSLSEGNSFRSSFKNYPSSSRLIPSHLQEIIIASEQSGRLQQTFLKFDKTFEEKSEESTKNLSVILEPILLVVVWFGVVGVALSVVLPLYQLVGGLQASVSGVPETKQIPAVTTSRKLQVKDNPAATSSAPVLQTVKRIKIISDTGNFARIRSQPNLTAEVLGKVNVGEVFENIDLQNGWYKIVLSNGASGWVFGHYAEILP
jgi:type IV pilus assembly protein PilC